MGENDTTRRQEIDRLVLTAFGALGGVCGWLLLDFLQHRDLDRIVLFLSVFAGGFFGVGLAVAMHMSVRRAMVLSGLVALPAAALMAWASLRFDDVGKFLASGHVLAACALLVVLPVPFFMAREQGQTRDYARLFLISWNIVVRYAAAWIFTAVVWAVVYLSDTLLQLVGLDVIERALEMDVVPWVITGAALGLGMAVVDELEDYVSPYLVLRLLRLLLPPVLVVVLVFLAALPMRGLSQLFGDYSAAGTLIAIALSAIALISIAVDASDDEMLGGRFMRAVARVLALTLPILAGLAIHAIWLRVAQYGWTPGRISAAAAALVVAGYASVYALSALGGQGWPGRIRAGNIIMAAAVLGLAALWLTPFLNAEAIAARSQTARIEAGRVAATDLPLREFSQDWGLAGQEAMDRLRARVQAEGDAAMQAEIARFDKAGLGYEFNLGRQEARATELRASILRDLVVLPHGQAVPDGILQAYLSVQELETIAQSCASTTAGGNAGCVLLLADLLPNYPGNEAMMFLNSPPATDTVNGLVRLGEDPDARWVARARLVNIGDFSLTAELVIDDLIAGRFTLEPSGINALNLHGTETLVLTP